MLRKDYIQRQFEEFGKVLALILGYKKSQDWERFETALSEAATRFTSLQLDRLTDLDEISFETEAIATKQLSLERKKILARLLWEKLEACLAGYDSTRAAALKQKCIMLYSYLKSNATENEYDLEVHYRLDQLNRMQA